MPKPKAYALAVLECLVGEYPGLIDGESEVSGADLVQSLSVHLHADSELREHLQALLKACSHEYGTRGGVCESCGGEV